jgi:hypothetical protein
VIRGPEPRLGGAVTVGQAPPAGVEETGSDEVGGGSVEPGKAEDDDDPGNGDGGEVAMVEDGVFDGGSVPSVEPGNDDVAVVGTAVGFIGNPPAGVVAPAGTGVGIGFIGEPE